MSLKDQENNGMKPVGESPLLVLLLREDEHELYI